MRGWCLQILMVVVGGSFGLLAAAGVFTVFVAVGIVPRFAGKTHTADRIFWYEEMVTIGSIVGGVVSIFPEYCQVGGFLQGLVVGKEEIFGKAVRMAGVMAQMISGLFAGMFVGCLALAIAEMLDSIPIFCRRIGFRHGLGLAVLGMAIGKLCGSLFYFWKELHRVVP